MTQRQNLTDSGKSTFLRCLNGLEEIDSGSIIIDGIPLDDDKKNRLEYCFHRRRGQKIYFYLGFL